MKSLRDMFERIEVKNQLCTGEVREANCDVSIWMRSCEKEILQPIDGTVTGTVPEWLRGSLLRNGPGNMKFGNMKFKHLFDCSALIHRFSIADGKITYQNRFLQTKAFKKNSSANRIIVTEFGTKAVPDPCHSIFKRVSSVFNPSECWSDNALVSIYPIADQYYAFTEVPVIHRIQPDTLKTLQRINVSNYINIVNHTSHPHIDKDGTVYNLGMTLQPAGPRYIIIQFPRTSSKYDDNNNNITQEDDSNNLWKDKRRKDASGTGEDRSAFEEARIVGSVPVRWTLYPSYMHSFGMTQNYFIIVEQPICVSAVKAAACIIANDPVVKTFKWFEKEKTMFYVISRATGKLVRSFSAEAFFYLHIINQYEDQGHIVIDICCYKNPSMLDCMYFDALKNASSNPNYAKMFRGRPLRYILPMGKIPNNKNTNLVKLPTARATAFQQSKSTVSLFPELLSNIGCETPRINYDRCGGKKYRYFYAISSDVDLENPGTLIKVDTVNRTRKLWCEPNVYPSEPVFVAAPNARREDDGVVLSALVWGGQYVNKVALLILDATTWTEIARSEFITHGPVPKCLHGWFIPSQ
ncbi:carotenoid isomerooxygenase [Bemisia tabaci]|uniref:carotenoid isomerooxygenase n=1 Tax=Bemisia tabaci TaxID=7038 RepID=UPI003B2800C0